MSKKTLLELTQAVLEEISGDEVNSISDTSESETVAKFIKHTYEAIVSHTNWPHTRRSVVLSPYTDSEFPTHMLAQENMKELISVRYNRADFGDSRKLYKTVAFVDPDHFLHKTNMRDNTKDNVDVIIDPSGIELLIINDSHPEMFTSFDDVTLVFDSYDSQVDSTLQQSKFQAQGYVIPPFNLTDDFIPDLPADAFSLLQEESTSRAQLKLRQIQDIKSEAESQKQSRWLSRKAWTSGGGTGYPNYGRKRGRVQGIQPWSD